MRGAENLSNMRPAVSAGRIVLLLENSFAPLNGDGVKRTTGQVETE